MRAMKRAQMVKLLAWVAFGLLLIPAVNDFFAGFFDPGTRPSLHSSRYWVFLGGILLLAGLWLAGLGLVLGRLRLSKNWRAAPGRISRGARRGLALCVALLPALIFLFTPLGVGFSGFWIKTVALLLAAALSAMLWQADLLPFDSPLPLALGFLAAGAAFSAGAHLTWVTAYPFSLSWSEGNRMWDWSTMFGSGRYLNPGGQPIFAFISPGRQFFWAVAYLIPNLPIWAMRLWDGLGWIWPGLLLGAVAMGGRGLPRLAWGWKLAFVAWVFLFLNQGPIYAPLVLSAAIMVVGVRQRRWWLAIPLVMLAAFYAQVSRWTWAYAPGLWAGLLALLDEPAPAFTRAGWKQLLRPVVLGVVGYAGGQFLPGLLGIQSDVIQDTGGVMIDPSASLTRQPLLWERLLPNTTFGPGILLATLWALLPIALLLGYLYFKKIWRPNLLQALAVAGEVGLFLGVGLVISVKIGGGGNLHNLDMLWITLALIAAWAARGVFSSADQPETAPFAPTPGPSAFRGRGVEAKWLSALLALALAGPVLYGLTSGAPLVLPPAPETQEALNALRQTVQQTQAAGGEVLFMDQRQLLTFDLAPRVPLVADYEKKYLMDQAMAQDAAYFQKFYRDLARQRFSLIISEPLQVFVQDAEHSFSEENNAWTQWVSAPILCYYEPVETYAKSAVQWLKPRVQPTGCTLPVK